jgi:division protein CdvB (Snf7/Vps24/ESCRT-III family)
MKSAINITAQIPDDKSKELKWSDGVQFPIDKIEQSLAKLRGQIERMDGIYRNLKERDKRYLDTCIEALACRDTDRASIYADEIVQMRKMAKKILHGQLVLEQIKVRLETLEEVGDVVGELLPFTSVINEIRGQLAGFMPEAASSLDDLNVHIGSIIAATATPDAATQSMSTEIDEEAKRILEEASNAAAEKVSESFPEIPCVSIEMMVFNYAKASPEKFTIPVCADELSLTEDQVKESLDSLVKKGLVVLEVKERELA